MTTADYELADRLLCLSPWNWMNEITLIAIEDPGSGRIDHISIMGMAGNHRSLALYHGPEARRRFNFIQEASCDEDPLTRADNIALILDTVQLQCSFSPRGDLYKSELAAIKKSGRKYRGENWPSFRSFRPGWCPRPADDGETRWLCTAIEQVLEIAPTLGFGDDTLRFENGRREILTRRRVDGVWQTCWTDDDDALFEFPKPEPDPFMLEKVRLRGKPVPMEVCYDMVPNPIGKTRETSLYPYCLLVVEPEGGFVLGFEVLSVESQTHEEMVRSVPGKFLGLCDRHSMRPASIAVDSPASHALLAPTAAALGIPCEKKRKLRSGRRAMDSMLGAMFGGQF